MSLRIRDIETIPLRAPLAKVFGGSSYRVDSRCTVITRVRTAEGIVGEAYNGDDRAHQAEVVQIIREELKPLVVGEDAFRVERAWARMFPIAHSNRDRKVAMEAIACVDTAIWDAIGKALGVSVCTLLGGFRTELPVIAIGGYYEEGKTLADLGREMEGLRQAGLAGCKVKVGGLGPEEDARRVRAAREGGGPDFIIAVDANRGWPVAEAKHFARLVEDLDVRWFEEPCHWYDDVAGMAEVRRHTRIPINAGQSEVTAHGCRRLLEAGAVDLINFDASDGGGITEWRRVAALASAFGAQMAHHEEPQIAAHLLAAVPHGTYVECFPDPQRDPLWAQLILNRPPIRDGILQVPQGPGLGLELDPQVIATYRQD